MKKIEFGYNGDDNLNATWSEIEFYNGEYLDTISSNNMDFLVTRIVDSPNGLNGNIDVREVAQDYYADGSYMTYANKEKSELCIKLEEYLNKVKEKLDNERPLEVLKDAGFPVFSSHLPKIESSSEEYAEIVTSIKPTVFKKLKESKKHGYGMSMFYMSEEIQRLYKKIETLEAENNKMERHH